MTVPVATVTPAQRAVIGELTADGASNGEIAERLGISVETVKNHMRDALAACGYPTRTALAVALLRVDTPVTDPTPPPVDPPVDPPLVLPAGPDLPDLQAFTDNIPDEGHRAIAQQLVDAFTVRDAQLTAFLGAYTTARTDLDAAMAAITGLQDAVATLQAAVDALTPPPVPDPPL